METVTKKKITVVVNGRFHAFDYASVLYKQNKLHRLISSMPYSLAKKYNIDKEHYRGLPVFEVIKRLWRLLFKREPPVLFYAKLFTKTALAFVPNDTEIVISFAGYSEEIFNSPKLNGVMKILDRGSTHTLSNIKLNKLAAEYHNIKWEPHPKLFIERELREYDLADKILIPSSFVKQTFIENGISADKLMQILYAVGAKKFTKLKVNSEKMETAVLFVGQISPRKGIGVLLNAMKLVREKIPGAVLWLVGHKNELTENSLLEKPWIKHFGILKGQELFDKYNQASVFCLLSFEEGLALVLTEALHCGLPVVATPNTGAEDIVYQKKDCFIVPVGDHEKAAEKIIEALEKTQSNISANEKNYDMSWEKFCEILINKIWRK